MKHRLLRFIKVFIISFAVICVALYCDARWFTPMPDNDSDLAAWGMRYALIPSVAVLYAAVISFFALLTRAVKVKFSAAKNISKDGI